MSPKFHDNLVNVQLKEHIQGVAGKRGGGGRGSEGPISNNNNKNSIV